MLMAVRVGCGSAVPQTRTRSGDPRFDPALRGHQRSAGAGQTAPSPLKGGVTGQLSQCHDLSPRRRMPRRRQDRGHASHLRRMQSPTDPADRTGTIGVEAFDAAYGAGFQASDGLAARRRVRPGATARMAALALGVESSERGGVGHTRPEVNRMAHYPTQEGTGFLGAAADRC